MGLALDEPSVEDALFQDGDLTIQGDLTVKRQVEMSGGIKIDFVRNRWGASGFSLTLANASGC